MSEQPRMMLNGQDEIASRKARKDELANRVLESTEEFGIFDSIKKKVGGLFKSTERKKVTVIDKETGKTTTYEEVDGKPVGTGKADKKTDWDEKKHPRGEDGRFKDAPDSGSTKAAGKVFDTSGTSKMKCDKNECSITGHDGKKLSIFADKKADKKDVADWSPESKRALLTALADVRKLYPNMPTTKIVMSKGVDGQAWANSKTKDRINVNAFLFKKTFDDINKQPFETDGFMPESKKANHYRYTMFHEFGHMVSYVNHDVSFTAKKKFLINGKIRKIHEDKRVQKDLSPYGRTNPWEGYAEAFAEWHLSKGKTKNKAAKAYAEYEGWAYSSKPKNIKPRKKGIIERGLRTILEAETVEFAEEPEFIIVDNFETGKPSIIGDYEWSELSPEEDKAIEDLLNRIYK